MRLEDSKTKKLAALSGREVGIYLCGPTVYDDAHLGHARSAVCFDILRRALIALGFSVKFARNYTDIDDKILKKMAEQNLSLKELTNAYILSYEADMKALNILKPNFTPRASEFVPQMIKYIEKLEKMGFTYALKDGIYFDTSKDEGYFSLSGRSLADTQSRLENGVNKKNASDFVLWKFDENFYEAPFGRGRPGWHTECVAMIEAIFGTNLDIHCGGADLLFPHHENEAAQCRCALNADLAGIWLHNGFVKIDGEKMSKSLNNSFFVKDALKIYQGEVLRFYLLQTHYRADFNYNEDDLNATKSRLDKFYRLKKRLKMSFLSDIDKNAEFSGKDAYANEILENLSDDLNISKALAVLDEFVNDANVVLDKMHKSNEIVAINEAFKDIARIFGVGFLETSEYFQHGVSEDLRAFIEAQIKERGEAKKAKNYKKADEIRANLAKLNIILQDTPNGTIWEKEDE